MKKNILTSAILILAMSFMVGCSSDDNTVTPPGGPGGGPDPGNEPNPEPTEMVVHQYQHKLLVEDITSTSCVWCPLASFTTEELAKSEFSDKIISIAVHGDFDTRNGKDPFVIPGMKDLMSALQLKGWPFVAFNRNTEITGTAFQSFIPKRKTNANDPAQYVFDPAIFTSFYTKYNLIADSSPIGIKIESELNQTSGMVNFSLKFGKDLNKELKYVVYIIEDGLVHQQANASTLYGNINATPRFEPNFVHNQVVRATNNFLGETIAETESVTTNEFKVSKELSYEIENMENVSVVVAILDKDGNVLNAQIASANATQDYQIIE